MANALNNTIPSKFNRRTILKALPVLGLGAATAAQAKPTDYKALLEYHMVEAAKAFKAITGKEVEVSYMIDDIDDYTPSATIKLVRPIDKTMVDPRVDARLQEMMDTLKRRALAGENSEDRREQALFDSFRRVHEVEKRTVTINV